MKAIEIIVPCRATETPDLTLESLARQTYRDFSVNVVTDYRKHGAPWARNFGLKDTPDSKYVLFSDADIRWDKSALEIMVSALERTAKDESNLHGQHLAWLTGYAYGGYYIQDQIMFDDKFKTFHGPIGNEAWTYEKLLQHNYISTMSLIRRDALKQLGPDPWDESLLRLQDWDIWLRLALCGWNGVWTGGVTFTTPARRGISFATEDRAEHSDLSLGVSYEQAFHSVRSKHGLI